MRKCFEEGGGQGPRVQRSKSPKVQESKGPRVQGFQGPGVPRYQGPKDQDISNSHSNTSLTLKKVHLVSYSFLNDNDNISKILGKMDHSLDKNIIRKYQEKIFFFHHLCY